MKKICSFPNKGRLVVYQKKVFSTSTALVRATSFVHFSLHITTSAFKLVRVAPILVCIAFCAHIHGVIARFAGKVETRSRRAAVSINALCGIVAMVTEDPHLVVTIVAVMHFEIVVVVVVVQALVVMAR